MLRGLKIVSFCHFLQGPACSQYLADMGADVIKIEPISGPFERHWSGARIFPGGVSGLFLSANRNKRSLALDLKSDRGKEIIMELVQSADILIENFRTGVMERLGLAYPQIKALKPDIIYASGTGWGLEGPMVGRTAQDLIIQARSGLISATGPYGRPTAVGAAIVDQHAGALLAMGILAAVVHRQRTGEGTHVQGSLLCAGLDLQSEPLTNYMSAGVDQRVFERQRNLISWYHEAPYGVYQIADGHVVIPTNDIGRLATALDSAELSALHDFDAYDARDRIAAAVAEAVRALAFDELSRRFDAHNIWYGRVNSYDDLRSDAQIAAASVFREVPVNGAPAVLVNHPLRYDGKVPDLHTLALETGAHSREILEELGRGADEIEELIGAGVVGAPSAPPAAPVATIVAG